MNTRIHTWCKDGKTKHDEEVEKQGYCSVCGKAMSIKRLRKLYKE